MDILALGIWPSVLGGCVGPIVGVAFGLAQWRLLRDPKRNPGLWLLANAIGWGTGLFVGSLLLFSLETVIPGLSSGGTAIIIFLIVAVSLGGGLAGIISGSMTGWALRRVLKN